jgi:hypothetical protein
MPKPVFVGSPVTKLIKYHSKVTKSLFVITLHHDTFTGVDKQCNL